MGSHATSCGPTPAKVQSMPESNAREIPFWRATLGSAGRRLLCRG
jgi:hypothetical protein